LRVDVDVDLLTTKSANSRISNIGDEEGVIFSSAGTNNNLNASASFASSSSVTTTGINFDFTEQKNKNKNKNDAVFIQTPLSF